jgi:hypothetical protein
VSRPIVGSDESTNRVTMPMLKSCLPLVKPTSRTKLRHYEKSTRGILRTTVVHALLWAASAAKRTAAEPTYQSQQCQKWCTFLLPLIDASTWPDHNVALPPATNKLGVPCIYITCLEALPHVKGSLETTRKTHIHTHTHTHTPPTQAQRVHSDDS